MLDWAGIRTYEDPDKLPPGGDHTLDQREYLAFQTSRGWWVGGRFDGAGGGRGGWGAELSVRGNAIVIHYQLTKASSGKWAGTYYWGVAICAADASGAMACTPRLPTGETEYNTSTRDCPGCRETPSLACDASFDGSTLTIKPMARAKRDDDPFWVPQYDRKAAAACSKLAYAGKTTIAMP